MRWLVTGTLSGVQDCDCPDCEFGFHREEAIEVKTKVVADTAEDAKGTAQWKEEDARGWDSSSWEDEPRAKILWGGNEE